MTDNPRPRVLVAGATGHLGRLVIRSLNRRGAWVRAVTRRRVPPSEIGAEEVTVWYTSQPLAPAFEGGIDTVFSALGNSVSPKGTADRRSFFAIDSALNRQLLETAVQQGVRRFVYVSLVVAPGYAHTAYARAHEEVVTVAKQEKIERVIVRPTGFFSAFSLFLDFARKGTIPVIGQGNCRTNPIDDRDLAEVCAEAILAQKPDCEIHVGGPEILTRQALSEAAFAAVNKRPQLVKFPAALVRYSPLPALVHPFDARIAELIEFYGAANLTDCIAPAVGKRRITDYFQAVAAGKEGEWWESTP